MTPMTILACTRPARYDRRRNAAPGSWTVRFYRRGGQLPPCHIANAPRRRAVYMLTKNEVPNCARYSTLTCARSGTYDLAWI